MPVPKARSTKGYFCNTVCAMPSCCIMQPQMPMSMPGRRFFTSLSQVMLPSALRSALSRMQQVLNSTRSACSRSSAFTRPIWLSVPARVSESWLFIWQPKVTIW